MSWISDLMCKWFGWRCPDPDPTTTTTPTTTTITTSPIINPIPLAAHLWGEGADVNSLHQLWIKAGGRENSVYYHTSGNTQRGVIVGRTFRALEPQNNEYCPNSGSDMDNWMKTAKNMGNIGVSLDCEGKGADYNYMKAFYASAKKFGLIVCICPQATLTAGGEPYWGMSFADASLRCAECGDIIYAWQYGSDLAAWQRYVSQTRAAGVNKAYIPMPDGIFRNITDANTVPIVNWAADSKMGCGLFYPTRYQDSQGNTIVSQTIKTMAQRY